MLSILDPLTIPGGTAYRDDGAWHRFYVVPSRPRVRRREDGSPVFLLVKYAFGDDDRAADKTLPRGGGYLQFDVTLALDDADAAATRTALQDRVNAEHARRHADPAYAADPLAQAAQPPPVEIADPLWSGGTVKLQTTQADNLVTHRVAEQPAALLTGNNAAFNLDLSDQGADFFRELLVTDAGTGRVDLAAVQVVYNLKMWARLPDFSVTLRADSERLQKVYEETKTTNADQACTPAEVETLQQKGLSASSLHASGVIEFHTTAPPGVPPEAVSAVRDYAYQLFDSMVREQFLAPVDDGGAPLPTDNGVEPRADDTTAAWLYPEPDFRGTPVEVRGDAANLSGTHVRSVQLRRGYSVTLHPGTGYAGGGRRVTSSGSVAMDVGSVRVTRPPETRLRARTVENKADFSISITLTQSQVVEWAVNPGSTLEPVFAGISAEKMKKHVVDLTLDGFRSRPVTAHVFANFNRLAAVELALQYEGTGADGRPVTKDAGHTFTAADNAPFAVDWTQIGNRRDYRYRYRTVSAETNALSVWSGWTSTTETEPPIAVVEPGLVDLEISGAALDWPSLRLCTVAFSAPTEDGDAVEHTVQLTPAAPTARWQTSLGRTPAGPMRVRYEYVLADGRPYGPVNTTVEPGQNLLVVPNPSIDVLNVAVVPGGDWSEVAMAVVVLKYAEADGTVKDDTFRFTAVDQYAEWKVPLRDPTRRDFTWESTITWRTDRPPEVRPARAASGDQTLPIVVTGRPKLSVTVNPALLDFTQVVAVQVNLTAATGETTSCAFSKGAANPPFVWTLPLAAGQAATWSWESIAFAVDGREIRSGVQAGAGNLLLVPRPDVAPPSAWTIQVRGNFVDFASTPLVTVDLSSNGQSTLLELDAQTKSGTWQLATASGRRYDYAITYFKAGGVAVPGESGSSDSPLLVLKALPPT